MIDPVQKISRSGLFDTRNAVDTIYDDSTFDITGIVKYPNVDSLYGPYNSLEAAFTALSASVSGEGSAAKNALVQGKTVGIIGNDGIVEYWFKSAIGSGTGGVYTQTDLVPKEPDLTDITNRVSSVESSVNTLTGVGTGSVSNSIEQAVLALDATASQSAGIDGLSLSVTEVNGKITNISGSIAANTYDSYGAAYTAKSLIIGDAASDYNTLGKVEDKIQEEVSDRQTAISGVIGDAASDYNTLGKLEDKIQAEASRAQAAEGALDTAKANKATTLAGYGIADAYTKTEVNGLVSTPHQEYATVATYASLPVTGSADTIYRVSNYDGSQSQVDASVYSEYAWDGAQYIFLRVEDSTDEVFDISVYNGNAIYADLAAALGTNGANVPSGVRKGGMSVKFVQVRPASYTVVKTEGLDSQPTGTELATDPDVESGTYNASQLTAFSTLPTSTGAGNAVTYWMEVAGDTTTYTSWVVTMVQTSDNKYVQYRYMLDDVSDASIRNAGNWAPVAEYLKPIKAEYDNDSNHLLDYSNDVQELYLLKQYFPQSEGIMFKCYENKAYCRYNPTTGWTARVDVADNGVIYKLEVYTSTVSEVPVGTVVGYVIFKNITHFLANSTGISISNVLYDVATDLTYSPVIDIYLRNGFVDNRMLKDGAVTYAKLEQNVINTLNNTSSPSVTVVDFPARDPYSEADSGYYEGYMLDLTGLYDKGYRGIVFRGATHELSGSAMRAGVVYDSEKAAIISAIGTTRLSNDYFILPITAAAKYFYGSTCKSSDGGEVFTVSGVHLVDVKTYNAIVNALYKTDIVNDLVTGGTEKALSAEQGKELNTYLFGQQIELPTIIEQTIEGGHPARINGNYTTVSGFYRRYTVDISALYAQGYNKVRFWGFGYKTSGNITAGLITTSTNINDNYIVESYVPLSDYGCGYYELSITQNSKYLIASVLSSGGVPNIGSNFTMPTGMTPDYVPSSVKALSNSSVGIGIVGRIEALEADVETLEDEIENIPTEFPGTFLPKKIYGVIGDTLQIFKRGCVISQTPYAMGCEFKCGQGKEYERYLEITPELASGFVPTGLTIKHCLVDDHYNKSEQKTSDLVLANTPSSPASNINVLCIGASTTENGEWASELKRRLTGSGGTPVANGLTNITFVGRRERAAYGTTRPVSVKVEATGGWTWKTFYTPQDAIRLVVSGVTAVNIGDVYTYQNASSQTVKVVVAEVNVTGDSGNIRFLYAYNTVGKGVPASASGTISKESGSGDATIAYSSASEETYCPFLDENNVGTKADFMNYASLYCNSQIDVAIFNLGNINASLYGDADMTTIMANMKVMLDGLHEDFPNAKAIIAPGIGYNTHYGLEYNYGANSNAKTWAALFAQFKYAKAIEDFIADNAYKNWCYLADTIAEVDAENVFPTSTKAVNIRVTDKTEIIGTNGAHPLLAGYQMTADAIYRCFVNVILN